ncbi:putative reverse transcriptase zinc-binding domain-containing protein [Helianthus annuus]|nr:putative reverse transcriptase zinc-binding domain-containing protein [Helianthus annuus]
MCSGLRINLHKSNLFGIGKSTEDIDFSARGMGCKPGAFPFRYLGIIVRANMNRISNWDVIVDTFKKRLSSWKANVVSMAGRVTLIEAVLESLPTYYFSLYKPPVTVINKLEIIIKRFLWGGCDEKNKIHWVAWDRVMRSIKDGGLGYRIEDGALWKKVVDAIHGSSRRWETIQCNNRFAGAWSRLVRAGYNLRVDGNGFVNSIKGVVGDGLNLRFWIDPWLTMEPLKLRFPRLFRLDGNKRCTVADRIPEGNGSGMIGWIWKRYPSSELEIEELIQCHRYLSSVVLSTREDYWVWSHDPREGYSVKEARRWMKGSNQSVNNLTYKWCTWVPGKCNIFMWRASLDRLSTKEALRCRNINVGDGACALCSELDETVDHLFSGCRVACGVWDAIGSWLKVPRFFVFSFSDVIQLLTICLTQTRRRFCVASLLLLVGKFGRLGTKRFSTV